MVEHLASPYNIMEHSAPPFIVKLRFHLITSQEKNMSTIKASMTVAKIQADQSITIGALANTLITEGKKNEQSNKVLFRTVVGVLVKGREKILAEDTVKAQMGVFGDLLYAELTPELKKEVPVASAGKTKGSPAFRSWPVTKVRWQYANYALNAIKEHGFDVVFPADKPIPDLQAVKDMQKGKPETALESIKRSLLTAQNKMKSIDPNDFGSVDAALQDITVAWAMLKVEHNEKK